MLSWHLVLERICSAALCVCVSALLCRNLAKLGAAMQHSWITSCTMTQQRHRVSTADTRTLSGTAWEQMCTAQCCASSGASRKAGQSAQLCMEILIQPWEAGKRHSTSTLCCPGLWAGSLDASWAISAWCWIPRTRNRLLGLLNSSP